MATSIEQAKEIIATHSFETVRDEVMIHLSKNEELIVNSLQLAFERGRQLGYSECVVQCEKVLGPRQDLEVHDEK